MEIVKNFKVRYLINILIALWIATWGYFMVLNWDIFMVEININLGFALIKARPFILFFLIGLLIVLLIQYFIKYSQMLHSIEIKEKNTQITLQEKDIEILKLKEMLFKEQSNEDISALHDKIEKIAKEFKEQKNGNARPES